MKRHDKDTVSWAHLLKEVEWLVTEENVESSHQRHNKQHIDAKVHFSGILARCASEVVQWDCCKYNIQTYIHR